MALIEATPAHQDLDQTEAPALEPATRVEVRSTLDQSWSRGFEIVEVSEQGYRLRRTSDGSELSGWVPASHVRRERKRGTWWI